MSIHRHAAKRDGNEPQIRQRFELHGWHTEQLSGKGMPDLIVFDTNNRRRCEFVDVKEPTGKPTPAQVEKWKALSAKGIPVYVARTEADVDAIVAGTADPWGVVEARPKRSTTCQKCGHLRSAHGRRGCTRSHGRVGMCGCLGDESSLRAPSTVKGSHKLGTNYAPPPAKVREVGEAMARTSVEAKDEARRRARAAYMPPRSLPVDAAREAAETFAPPPYSPVCEVDGCFLRPVRDGKCSDHA